ncbi:DUF86 domain-containing protein [Candidatus Woesearchaeota archaeon]|nr:DUF86 domain-containing protein [Candidatus Woesearchaeota archaeon]
MKKDAEIFLEHILESIEKIESYTAGVSEKKFKSSDQIQDAVIRNLEVIGEAAKNVPADFRGKFPEIRWKEISGMRDILIHQYFGVDLDIIWKIISDDLPKLEKAIKSILKRHNQKLF